MSARTGSLASAGVQGAAVTIAGQGGILAVKLAGLVVLARLLSPEIYGVMAVATAAVTIIVMATSMGIPEALLQSTDLSRRAEASLFYLSLVLGIVFSLVTFAVAPIVASIWGHEELEPVMRTMSVVPVFTAALGFLKMHLARNLRFTSIAVSEFVSAAFAFVVAVYFALEDRPYAALTAMFMAQPMVQLAIVAVVARWLPGRPGTFGAEERKLLSVAGHLLGIEALRQASRQMVVPAVGLVAQPGPVGLFDRAQQLVLLPIQLTVEQMKSVAVPVLSRVRDEPNALLSYYRRAQQLASYGTSTMFLVLAALAEPVVGIVLGPAWVSAVPLVQILAVGGVARSLGLTVQWLHMGGGATRGGVNFNIWAMPLQVAITLLGAPWGVYGVAISSGVGWLVYWPLAVWNASRLTSVKPQPIFADAVRAVTTAAIPAGLAAAAASTVAEGPILSLAAGLAAASAALVAVAMVEPRVRRDARSVIRLVRTTRVG